MPRGVNKVILLGNLGQDPEVHHGNNGTVVVNLNVATTDTWIEKPSGQKQERTEWHKVVMFNKLAEIAQQYLKKGAKVYIEGRLQTRKWQDQNGQDRYSTEIVANDMQMLDGNNTNSSGQQNQYPQQNQNYQQNNSSQQARQRQPQSQQRQQAAPHQQQQNYQQAPAPAQRQGTPVLNPYGERQ